MLKIDFYRVAEKNLKQIKKSNPKIIDLILLKINELRKNPFSNNPKKLKSYNNLYRIKVNNYRIVYEFDNQYLIIILVDTRSKVYEVLERLFR